ncbi:Alpha/Beta hydrolase protein [Flammula alnicola]|nr:Alpha/Beta hydrolase protein [Flammula alnicola]
MEVIAGFKDREIAKVIDPTVAAFAPLLKARKKFISEIPKKSFKYGATDRHQLDVYYPTTVTSEKTPILFFIYGGGFNTGERSISPRTFGLVYACVGAFYARRGYIVVIPDYRLVPHVHFPGPAEDVRDAVRWVVQNVEHLVSSGSPSPDTDKIVMMGHSAGAAHVATMLFHANVLAENDELRPKIIAAILESPPVLIEGLPKILMVEGEFEPDWLVDAGRVFEKEVRGRTGEQLKKIVARGHNHISLNWALSSGEGEEWAEQVVEWLSKLNA